MTLSTLESAGCSIGDIDSTLNTVRDPEGHVWTFGTYDPWTVAAK